MKDVGARIAKCAAFQWHEGMKTSEGDTVRSVRGDHVSIGRGASDWKPMSDLAPDTEDHATLWAIIGTIMQKRGGMGISFDSKGANIVAAGRLPWHEGPNVTCDTLAEAVVLVLEEISRGHARS